MWKAKKQKERKGEREESAKNKHRNNLRDKVPN